MPILVICCYTTLADQYTGGAPLVPQVMQMMSAIASTATLRLTIGTTSDRKAT